METSTLTDKEIKTAIDALRSEKPIDLEYFKSDKFTGWISPRAYFYIKNEELCAKAAGLNKKHARDIFDRRTKGWKLIKSRYEEFLALPEL